MRLLSLAALSAVTFAQLPPWPTQYTVTGSLQLPLGNITEQFRVFFDGNNQRQRVEMDAGVDTFIYRSDINVTWEVCPEVTQMSCFEQDGPVSLTSYLPDTTGFQLVNVTVINGQQVQDWQLTTNNYGRISTYDLFLSVATGNPVMYHMAGYDSLLDSHFDEYYVYYDTYTPGGNFPNGAFDQPNLPTACHAYPENPGQGVHASAALTLAAEIFSIRSPVHPKDDDAFAAFIAEFGKNYETEEELRTRHSIFTRNKRLVERKNVAAHGRGRSLRLAINSFADATRDEMTQRMGRAASPSTGVNANPAVVPQSAPAAGVPASFDWRNRGFDAPPYDQGVCGSCWAHGATQATEGQYFVKTGQILSLSRQEVVDCTWPFGSDGCDGGNDYNGYEMMITHGGLASEESYGPYLAINAWCKVANSTAGPQPAVKVVSYVNLTSGDVQGLVNSIATIGPISVSMEVLDDFVFYYQGTYDNPDCSNDADDLDHTILGVGYGVDDAGVAYITIKNSWNYMWGNQGYANIKQGICGIATTPTYPIIDV